MLGEIVSLTTNGLIIPALIYLALKLRAVERSNKKVLEWLEKYCPQCGAIRIFSSND